MTGEVWRLHRGGLEIARLVVTGGDFPWMHARVETLAGFEEFRPVFAELEQALDAEEYERADVLDGRVRSLFTMTFPDGEPVAEFLLRIYADGTAGWRWHDEPFD
ncbi:hypothetical protein UK23_16040 [Lentzea aerocolonigenes]|uniref:Uncharacterized protein n=1 Tax=Lentzea aerocolonigenes TaxID=68170 RepID=A0A0F0H1G5_LENAE|nr:hypothetical protein [Lentzea aerocolonigenes]KJK48686.1 hypothetical protein UK23_16040 [Lentzea aerocolonigenes]